MSYDYRQVQRLRFAIETSFGTDLTSDVANNFDDLRHMPTAIGRETQMAPDETVVQRDRQRRNDVLGPDKATCPIECYWTPTNEAIDADTTATQDEQQKFLEHVFGGYVAPGQGSLSASGEATTGCVVTGTEGGQFDENTFIATRAAGAGAVVPRLVATVSTDTLVWWPALSAAPSTGDTIYNAQNIYYDDTTQKWVQLLVETVKDRGNIWLLRGGAAHDFKMTLNRGGLVKWSCTVQGAVYDHDDEITTPQGGSSLAAASYTDGGPVWGDEGGCHFGPTSSSALASVRCVAIEINFGLGWIDVGDQAGTEGMGEWYRDSRGRIEVSLTMLKDASAGTYELWHDAWKAETDYGFLWWLGATAGSGLAIAGRTGQITKVEAVEHNGLEAQKVTLLMKENNQSSGGSTPTSAATGSPLVLGHW